MTKIQPASSYLSNITEREYRELQRLVDYTNVESLPEIWPLAAKEFGNTIALHNPHAKPEIQITYNQLAEQIQRFASGLQALIMDVGNGETPTFGDRISLIADNSPRWFIADQGIMTAGAVNAVRSAQAEREELLFIIANSGSTVVVVEDIKTFNKIKEGLNDLPIKLVILLADETPPTTENFRVVNFLQVLEIGSNHTLATVKQSSETLATLIYTSGTTGKPKGVMLSHQNLLHQVKSLGTVVQPQKGNIVLSILPTWHSYERSGEYFLLSQGCTQIYTNLRAVKQDLKKFKPNYMIAVPRLWESIYEGVQKQFREQPAKKQQLIQFLLDMSQKYITARRITQGLSLDHIHASSGERLGAKIREIALWPFQALGEKLVYAKVREATGGKIKQVISGGGALPRHIDNFFEIVGVEILQGYGLTETSPVTNARRPWRNLRGSSGQPIPGTEVKIVNPETRQPLPVGERGLVLLKGPQIMQGYYQNPEATKKVIDAEGWFDSGDLGWVTPQNDLVLTGRAKDTIVLTNGENIEPQPIEDACLRSPYVDQIMLVGQDQRSIGALIVPNLEALEKWAETQNDKITASTSQKIDLESKIIQDLFRQELNREVKDRPGYRADDRIGPFKLILEPFSIENGLMTQTLKVRRHVVMDRYRDIIDGMFAN
ncbi:long-chain fatty acid--CoA ligase [Anabaena cylindrica FACHB-243]|uniref:Long-chain-fatty-acid--CoA ligase n=1 Tax=Anabaena cylindrica (strain ATCC 27899 / PCC 7122) TaxID=272123 RepID=K9ZD22_ANACC|nr:MULTISPECIES: long-chain fatty acid--CoA ligase [Anabaena]AFZ56250.1 Long-chain-fatty-acid--CoA ligase [Anabaena cylindrica PCC 7122]MBD2417478.1 long-chain fatty acid--CoA ligase [Anabaena cylindrica FACHB-243]MBY5285072.1 long-chain fatty acid--CoA ligase [Anabaena sp. CCAP 1446/1C]MBY5307427.1 long-chain fatty acid--CoA ligase [Anabaena sp. CCAP 1446/1C]MCM2407646.1 long-chain fatty acid--CoA ligase [Anabaena sp. CCAP 1446/1C]